MRLHDTKSARKASGRSGESVRNRRAIRTREAMLRAFRDLILMRGYDAISVRDVILRAEVGRSTFYEHFENKDDLLRQSIHVLLVALAEAANGRRYTEGLPMVVEHFWQNRRLARRLLLQPTRSLITSHLAALISERLERSSSFVPVVPAALAAAQIANGQLGLLEAWVSRRAECPAESIAAAICVSSRALADALRVA